MEQPQYNMFYRERVEKEYAHLYKEYGLGTTIWSPLASGLLTGKYNEGIPKGSRFDLKEYAWLKDRFFKDGIEKQLQTIRDLNAVAVEIGASLAQMSLAWCLKNKNVSTVITGASKVTQIEENLKSLTIVKSLDDSVMARIEHILQNKPKAEIDWREN
jgi:aryl-alcohol dehydrogenase-like predicted oxidoreductase